MNNPDDPVHPLVAAFLAAIIVIAIAARIAFTHGPMTALGFLLVGWWAILFIYSTAEMLTWGPDDPRWEGYIEAQRQHDPLRNRRL